MNLSDLRAMLDERSGSTPAEMIDHARSLSSIRRKIGARRRRRTVAGLAIPVVLVLTVGYAVASYSPARRAEPARPHPSAVASPSSTADPGPSPVAGTGPSPSHGPSPTPGKSRPSGFPDATNTGVPAGTPLVTYTGSCTITANNTVIDAKVINCSLDIRATGVTIRRSRINGTVHAGEGTAYSYTLEDSEVNGGGVAAVVGATNLTVVRSTVHGGTTSIYCYTNCTVRDSYLDSFLANDNGPDPGGRTNAMLVHNTIACSKSPGGGDAGCSGDVKLFADYGPLSYVTVDDNLLGASTGLAYCVFGGSNAAKPYKADHIVFVNNVFQRGTNSSCGAYGPVTDFDTERPSNRWANNVWDDGRPVAAKQ